MRPRAVAAPKSVKIMTQERFLSLVKTAYAKQMGVGSKVSNWMGDLRPLLDATNATLLDLTLPGSHDVVTYDLTTHLLPHDVTEVFGKAMDPFWEKVASVVINDMLSPDTSCQPDFLGKRNAGCVFRQLGQAQGITILQQLDAGIRFLDMRIAYVDKVRLHTVEFNFRLT